jgi:hypothetical protein
MTATAAVPGDVALAVRDGLAVVATWEGSGQLGLSPATRRTYHACLVRFVRWLSQSRWRPARPARWWRPIVLEEWDCGYGERAGG